MIKYGAVACLLVTMAVTISIIDARSTDVGLSPVSRDTLHGGAFGIYATGIVEGVTEDIHLRSEHAGRVSEVLATAGKWVEAGDVLIRLDGDRQQYEVALAAARLELAEAELERLRNGARPEEREEVGALVRAAQSRLDQATRNLARMEQLRSDRAVTEQEVDDHRALVNTSQAELEAAQARLDHIEAPARADELRAAEARVCAARAEMELAQIGLEKTELCAPRRACVLDVNTERGELTGPNSTQPLVVLADTSTIRIRAFVEELDAPRIKIGMNACITADGLPGAKYSGCVVSISPCMSTKSIDAGRPHELYDTKVREVLIELSEASDLFAGLRVDVEFDARHDG
jgi:multidrug resistance efflux pump